MRRKGFMKRGICLAVAMAMLSMTGCGAATQNAAGNSTTEANVEAGEFTQVAAADNAEVIDMIKGKYEASTADYSGNVIEVERDEPIKLQLGFNPYDLEDSLKGSIKIYQDAEMTQPIELFGDEYDAETGTLTIYAPTFGIGEMMKSDNAGEDISDLFGSYIYDPDEEYELDLADPNYDVHHGSGWGTLSQYYMVSEVNLETGEKLEKPEITVIKIKSEISKAPQMKFTQTENGEAKFYWQPVEGATEYLIFQIKDWGEETGLDETACVVGRTTDCEWICENNIFDFGLDIEMEGEVSGVMNSQFEHYYHSEDSFGESDFDEFDEYWDLYYGVLAINENGASPMSNLMNEKDLSHMLPNKLAYNTNDTSVDTISELPATVGITMCDGTTAQKVVDYDFESLQKKDGFDSAYELTAKVDGTIYVISFSIYKQDEATIEAEAAAIEERQNALKGKGGNMDVDVDFEDGTENPETEAPEVKETESEVKDTESETKETESEVKETESETKDTESEVKETESEAKETEEKQDNDLKSTEIDLESNVTANSALSEYIARNMLVTNNMIDISAFPEASDMNVVQDAVSEAMYQNPLVLGVQDVGMDTLNNILYVEYDFDAETTAQKQQEIIDKANEVVAEIITDDMTDWEKGYAINQYLCENAEYDYDALENAEQYDFYDVDEDFYDSFTAYGCLVKGVGVCASYSADYKVLADAAGLESIVVTGYLEGATPHAWNKVKINGNWHIVDSTNNDNDYISNALLNLSDSAASATLMEDGRFALDDTVSTYAANSDEMEYYHVMNSFFEQDEISDELKADLSENGTAMLRTDYNLDDAGFGTIAQEVVNSYDKELQGGYWMGVIFLQEK